MASATIPPGEDLLLRLEPDPPPRPVLEEEFALDEEEVLLPGPPDAPAPAPARAGMGRDTIASPPREAEEIRRQIRRPPSFEPAITFEAIDDDEEEIEELTLEAISSEAHTEPSRAPAEPLPPAMAAVPPASVTTPVTAQADVEVPVVVAVSGETTHVQLNLRIKLQLRRDR
jgi:hypothetical protein